MGGACRRQELQQGRRCLLPRCAKLHVAAAAQAARLGVAPLRRNALIAHWVLHRPCKHSIRSSVQCQ